MSRRIPGIKTRLDPGDCGYGLMGAGFWLNDECMNYHIELFNINSHTNDAIILSTFFYTRFLKDGYLKDPDMAVRFLWGPGAAGEKVGAIGVTLNRLHCLTILVQRKQSRATPWKRIIMPFNTNNNHWQVACVDTEKRKAFIYDSLAGKSNIKGDDSPIPVCYFSVVISYSF